MKKIIFNAALSCFLSLFSFLSLNAQCPPPTGFEICGVTVDTGGTYLDIVWDKTGFQQVDTFLIQRMISPGNYATIGRVPYDSLSWFHDYGVNLAVDTPRYKMGIIDTCGFRYDTITPYHQPHHVTQFGPGQFQWSYYWIENVNPAIAVQVYYLERDSLGNGVWDTVATVAGSQCVLYDPPVYTNPQNYPFARWRVTLGWNRVCVPVLRLQGSSSTQNSTISIRSNINSIHYTAVNENKNESIKMFPNPVKDILWVKTENPGQIKIFDLLGNEMLTVSATSSIVSLNVNAFPAGVYLIQVGNNFSRFVKE